MQVGLLGDVMLGRGVAQTLTGTPPEPVGRRSEDLRELAGGCDPSWPTSSAASQSGAPRPRRSGTSRSSSVRLRRRSTRWDRESVALPVFKTGEATIPCM